MAKTQAQREQDSSFFKNIPAFSGFSAKDLKAEKAFFSEKLGIDVDDRNGMLFLNIKGNNPILIYPKDDHTPASFTIMNFPVDDIEAAVDELTASGVTLEEYDVPGLTPNEKLIYRGEGPPIAWFKDPSGNIFSVIEDTAEE